MKIKETGSLKANFKTNYGPNLIMNIKLDESKQKIKIKMQNNYNSN